jgi:hypothetical protein
MLQKRTNYTSVAVRLFTDIIGTVLVGTSAARARRAGHAHDRHGPFLRSTRALCSWIIKPEPVFSVK